MREVTRILSAIDGGDPHAAGQLLLLVYDELRRLAAQKLAHEAPGQTLDATSLVHEAYLRLVGSGGGKPPGEEPHWDSRGHFFAAAAEAMRRILVERARHKATLKHGGKLRRLDLDQVELARDDRSQELLALDEALAKLEQHDALAGRLVKLRYAGGATRGGGGLPANRGHPGTTGGRVPGGGCV
jgi:RNA polymerase sigma factor (TIGR02999 family)